MRSDVKRRQKKLPFDKAGSEVTTEGGNVVGITRQKRGTGDLAICYERLFGRGHIRVYATRQDV